uniref:MIR domain-containing protein n=1 Tax=Pyramimonas obovata TaxID=1411642 RepID=A0A7S0MRV7_9CHLO
MSRVTIAACVLMLCTFTPVAGAIFGGSDGTPVTCGSTVKLQHSGTKYRLHSHEVAYGSGSGQQSVTCYEGGDDANSYWTIQASTGPKANPCPQGTVLKHGDAIRLQHVQTKKWLHSHLHQSPLSGNQEVSCYGNEQNSDTGDNWVVQLEKGSQWNKDDKVRLMHVDTSAYLGSHDKKFGRPIAGQQEVCAFRSKNSNGLWMATEGIYMPVAGSEASEGEL